MECESDSELAELERKQQELLTALNALDSDEAAGSGDEFSRFNETAVEAKKALNTEESCNGSKGPEKVASDEGVFIEDGVAKRNKVVLEHFEIDAFGEMPDGWSRVTHNSGLPVYYHAASRVVSVTKPYFLGDQPLRNHSVPIAAVPCLWQKKLNEKNDQRSTVVELQKRMTAGQKLDETGAIVAPAYRIDRQEESLLSPDGLNEYAQKIFRFKTIQIECGRNFRERRARVQKKQLDEALCAAGVNDEHQVNDQARAKAAAAGITLINIPTNDEKFHKRNFTMNPEGKTSLSVLHEYVQRGMKGKILYDVQDNRNPNIPYRCIAYLIAKSEMLSKVSNSLMSQFVKNSEEGKKCAGAKEGEEHYIIGRGVGQSKRIAKLAAAKESLAVFIPNLFFDENYVASLKPSNEPRKLDMVDQSVELFDNMAIDDVRITDLCIKTLQPKPLTLLRELMSRSYKAKDDELRFNVKLIGPTRAQVELNVGALSAVCETGSSKVGKQRTCQSILRQLHEEGNFGDIPATYGSLLRFFTNQNSMKVRPKTELPERSSRANEVVLRKLREELMNIEQKATVLRPPVGWTACKVLTGAPTSDNATDNESNKNQVEWFPMGLRGSSSRHPSCDKIELGQPQNDQEPPQKRCKSSG